MTQSVGVEKSCDKGFVPGDVVEVRTDCGWAYVQVTHLHYSYPEIVRVLPGLHDTPCDSAELLVNLPNSFRAITPLAAAIASGRLTGRHMGHYSLPTAEQGFPNFRMPVRDRLGEVIYWWLWDGDGLSYIEPGAASVDVPIREVISPEALRGRLVAQLSRKEA
ncbi:MAG: hypothetical protein JXQ99_21920 [Hyphomicrobiaceae bacterium]